MSSCPAIANTDYSDRIRDAAMSLAQRTIIESEDTEQILSAMTLIQVKNSNDELLIRKLIDLCDVKHEMRIRCSALECLGGCLESGSPTHKQQWLDLLSYYSKEEQPQWIRLSVTKSIAKYAKSRQINVFLRYLLFNLLNDDDQQVRNLAAEVVSAGPIVASDPILVVNNECLLYKEDHQVQLHKSGTSIPSCTENVLCSLLESTEGLSYLAEHYIFAVSQFGKLRSLSSAFD